jgi:hypothetical protein
MPTCPNCRHTWTAPKRTKPQQTAPDTAEKSEAELYAHYKRTAPAEDIAFWIANVRMSAGLLLWFKGLALAQPDLNRTDFYRQFRNLQDAWRRERNAEEIAERLTDVA